MNENENKNGEVFEDAFSCVPERETENTEPVIPEIVIPEADSVPERKVTFDFPRPPINNYVFEEKKEEVTPIQTPAETEPEQFNPYKPPVNNTAFVQNNPYVPSNTYQQNQETYNQYTPDMNGKPYHNETFFTPGEPAMPPKKNGGKKIAVVAIIACVILAIVIGAISLGGGNKVYDQETVSGLETTVGAVQGTTGANTVETTALGIVDNINSVTVAEKVRPSVVGVLVYSGGQLAGEGSGILWTEDATHTYIITCAHVIEGSKITYGILLLDGSYYEAEFVGADARTDIGVLKVEATGLSLAEFGSSDSLKIGEPVYAIGNPGGSTYFGSMTDGIVSSIDRSITSTYTMTVIQHSAAINPGNSGGALVNISGQIVGVNSSKIVDTEYEGMGFAVPTSIAVPIAQSLVQYGYVPNRPKLGIEYATASSYQLYSLVVSIKGLPQGSLVIAGISEDSSLVGTEAEVGDLIIAVNGKDMDDSSVLLDLIEKGAVGDTLTLTLCRIESRTYKISTFDVTITLVEDRGTTEEEEEEVTENNGGYYYGGSNDFEDFFNDYFGW